MTEVSQNFVLKVILLLYYGTCIFVNVQLIFKDQENSRKTVATLKSEIEALLSQENSLRKEVQASANAKGDAEASMQKETSKLKDAMDSLKQQLQGFVLDLHVCAMLFPSEYGMLHLNAQLVKKSSSI